MTSIHHPLGFLPSGGVGERRPVGRRLRRIGLGVFFASVTVNAALGIYAVLAPDFGETQGRILGTSLCVTGAALVALACEPAWERKLLGPVPYLGAVLGAVGFALAIVGIWAEPDSDTFVKATASAFVVAGACTVASLLVLARLAPGHQWVLTITLAALAVGAGGMVLATWLETEFSGREVGTLSTIVVACVVAILLARARLAPPHEWVLAVTVGLLAVGATLVAILPWFEGDPGEWYLRGMGVALIALAAFAVTVPVLNWIDRGTLAVAQATAGEIRHCPYCGSALAGEADAALACGRCGREFRVLSIPSSSSDLT